MILNNLHLGAFLNKYWNTLCLYVINLINLLFINLINFDSCNMGPCIIMLQHEVMVVDEWHNNGPQDLVTVSLCIQNALNKNAPVFVVRNINLP